MGRLNLPLPPRLSSVPAIDRDALAWAALFKDQLEKWASGLIFRSATPPGSPTNGDLWMLPNANGVNWLFRYNAASASASKWESIGGPGMNHEIATVELTGIGPTAYLDLATVGPTLTVPRAGDYDIEFGCQTYYTAGGPGAAVTFMSPKLGAAATVDADCIQHDNQVAAQGYGGDMRAIRRTLAAGDVVKCQYKINGIANGNFGLRWMTIRPVRVA